MFAASVISDSLLSGGPKRVVGAFFGGGKIVADNTEGFAIVKNERTARPGLGLDVGVVLQLKEFFCRHSSIVSDLDLGLKSSSIVNR